MVSPTPRPIYRCPLCRRLAPTGLRSTDRPACSESLYQLSYPGPQIKCDFSITIKKKLSYLDKCLFEHFPLPLCKEPLKFVQAFQIHPVYCIVAFDTLHVFILNTQMTVQALPIASVFIYAPVAYCLPIPQICFTLNIRILCHWNVRIVPGSYSLVNLNANNLLWILPHTTCQYKITSHTFNVVSIDHATDNWRNCD